MSEFDKRFGEATSEEIKKYKLKKFRGYNPLISYPNNNYYKDRVVCVTGPYENNGEYDLEVKVVTGKNGSSSFFNNLEDCISKANKMLDWKNPVWD